MRRPISILGVLPGASGSEEQCTWETQAPDTGILSGTRLSFVASVPSNCAQPDPTGCFKAEKRL